MLEGLAVALARAAKRRAVVAGLLIGLVAVLSRNVDQAGWVAGVQFWPGAWLALLGAAWLARARWKGRWALLYTVTLIMAGAAELVGHLLPGLVAPWQAPGAWVLGLHLRAITLGLRLQAWGAAIAHGQPVGDTGLFVWLLAVVEWGAVAWLAWSVLRRRQALAGCLPAAVILALNTRLSAQPWQEVLLFVALMLALMIYATFTTQHLDWDRRAVDYPGDVWIDWSTVALALTFGIGMLGAAAPLVAAPSGWQLLSDLLASPRQQVAASANQLFSGVKPPSGGPQEPMALTPDLTNIGSAIDQSQGTVMWVKIDEPGPAAYPGAPPPPQHYWRSGLYVNYTGAGWQSLPVAPGSAAPPQGNEPLPGRYAVQQQFEIVANHGLAQFAVNRPVSATTGALVGPDSTDGGTALLAGPASTYSVKSLATRVSQAELRAASTDYPPAIRFAYLQLPASLPARVAILAAQITNGVTDPYDQALRLQDYLRSTYSYRLDVPPPPAGRDAVDYFLYEAPGGFCSYFASAMAVMLRTVGVPARVATGYAMGEYDTGRRAYRVPGAAAHAWVEVYFPAYGWVEFEPTPARAVFDRPLGSLDVTPPVATPGTGVVAAQPAASRAIAVVLGLALALLAAAGWVWWQLAARREPATPGQRVLRLYGRMRSALARAGLAAKASMTADEYLMERLDVLATRPSLLAAMTEATDLYRQAAYSRHPVSEAQARAAQHLWEDARLAWIGLALQRFTIGQFLHAAPVVKSGRPQEGNHG